MLSSDKPRQLISDGAGGRSNNSARKLIHQHQTLSAYKKREVQQSRDKMTSYVSISYFSFNKKATIHTLN